MKVLLIIVFALILIALWAIVTELYLPPPQGYVVAFFGGSIIGCVSAHYIAEEA
jgi:hypothetical protein